MENRDVRRISTGDEVLFSIDNVVMRGWMTDLSAEGCRITDAGSGDMAGAPVEVTLLQGVIAHGKVVWQKDGCIGVDFDKPLSESTVKYFRLGDWAQSAASEPTDGFGRPLPPLPFEDFRRTAAG